MYCSIFIWHLQLLVVPYKTLSIVIVNVIIYVC